MKTNKINWDRRLCFCSWQLHATKETKKSSSVEMCVSSIKSSKSRPEGRPQSQRLWILTVLSNQWHTYSPELSMALLTLHQKGQAAQKPDCDQWHCRHPIEMGQAAQKPDSMWSLQQPLLATDRITTQTSSPTCTWSKNTEPQYHIHQQNTKAAV